MRASFSVGLPFYRMVMLCNAEAKASLRCMRRRCRVL